MKKFLFLLILLFIPISVYALDYPSVDSKKVEIYDFTDGKVLYEKSSLETTSIASLTKLATIMTAIDSIDNLDEEVIITRDILNTVSWDASVAGLRAGDKVTYKDLLYAAMLPSGADATNSIAILTSGSIDNYVNKMNEFILKIGLTNTHFVNVTGLDAENHYSTADDIRKLLEYSLKNETFKTLYTTKEYTMSNGKLLKSTLYKYNASDEAMNKILGSKTGHTGNAEYCLSSLSNINGHEIIIIVLNASSNNGNYYHITDTLSFINFISNNYKDEVLVENNKLIKTLPVYLSKIDKYDIYSDKKIVKYLPSDYDINNLKIKYKGLDELNYRNKKNDKIGTISYYYEDELLYKQDVILNKNIKLDFIKLLKKYSILIISISVILIVGIIIFIKRHKKNK